MSKVRVLIADDSALMRKLLKEILSQDPEIEVVGAVSDAFKAREEIKKLNPDVLTLDIEMPKMDGISFLEKLMRLRPMPVVMISAMTEKGADITMKALMMGAVDFISKPKVDLRKGMESYGELIRTKVKDAAVTKVSRRHRSEPARAIPKIEDIASRARATSLDMVAIGASTGGVEVINQLLSGLPGNLPPVLITQHIPPVFSASLATRLNDQVSMTVKEAVNGEELKHGHAYIAPGDRHLIVKREGSRLVVRLDDSAPVNRHIPSVEVLFNSVAEVIGKRSIGVILTGMGSDGAKGLLNMRERGAVTIAQDQASSIVWGMPREAVLLNAAQHVLPPEKIVNKIVSLCEKAESKGEARDRYGSHTQPVS